MNLALPALNLHFAKFPPYTRLPTATSVHPPLRTPTPVAFLHCRRPSIRPTARYPSLTPLKAPSCKMDINQVLEGTYSAGTPAHTTYSASSQH